MPGPSDLIVSVSGVRGIVGDALTPEVAALFAAALGTYLGGGRHGRGDGGEHGGGSPRIVVSRDSRPSGEMLKHAVLAGLFSTGCHADDIGIAPTPTTGVAVRRLNAAGGVQITASHNPAPWNGLKLFGPDGAVLSAEKGRQVQHIYETGAFARVGHDRIGTVNVPPDVLDDHLRLVLDHVSVATIASAGFRVFLDANAGAGGPLGVRLLQELGCEVVQHQCDPTGEFAHDPEPIPAHLADVAPWVQHNGCAIGFVLDPDSDRLALIDETGACVSEELTPALATKARLRQGGGPVVVNMSSTRTTQDVAVAAGCAFHRSAVGEANVVEVMRACGAVLGGEGSGGVIDPRVGWVRDPFIGMALILTLLAEERKAFSAVVADLPRYAMLKTKFAVAKERLVAGLSAIQQHWPDAAANGLDGLRLDGPDWWLHVRPSNTEPVVRVIAEAPNPERARQLCDEAGALLT